MMALSQHTSLTLPYGSTEQPKAQAGHWGIEVERAELMTARLDTRSGLCVVRAPTPTRPHAVCECADEIAELAWQPCGQQQATAARGA